MDNSFDPDLPRPIDEDYPADIATIDAPFDDAPADVPLKKEEMVFELPAEDPDYSELLKYAQNFIVHDEASYMAGCHVATQIDEGIKGVGVLYDDICSDLFKAHRRATSKREALKGPLVKVKEIMTGKLFKFTRDQEAARLAEQRRLDEEERLRLKKIADDEAAERQKQADELQRSAELLEKAGHREQAELTINRAAELQQEAVEIVKEALAAPAPVTVLPSRIPSSAVSGFIPRGTWTARVTSLMALVKAVAEGKVAIECLQANETFLNQQARAFKGNSPYPGVEFYEKPSGSTRKTK